MSSCAARTAGRATRWSCKQSPRWVCPAWSKRAGSVRSRWSTHSAAEYSRIQRCSRFCRQSRAPCSALRCGFQVCRPGGAVTTLPAVMCWPAWIGSSSSPCHGRSPAAADSGGPSRRNPATISRVASRPSHHAWVGQVPLTLGTVPTVVSGGLDPRPAVLRTFALAAEDSYRIMAGGLVRAAPTSDGLLVSNQSRAVSIGSGPAGPPRPGRAPRRSTRPLGAWWSCSRRLRPSRLPGPDSSATVREPGCRRHEPSYCLWSGMISSRGRSPMMCGACARWASPPDGELAVISPRVAEDMFWLGRYAERAEAVVRLLRVTEDRWRAEHPDVDPALAGERRARPAVAGHLDRLERLGPRAAPRRRRPGRECGSTRRRGSSGRARGTTRAPTIPRPSTLPRASDRGRLMTGSQTFRIVHRTDYEYDKPVTMSYGRAHLTPRGDGGQERLDAPVAVDPPPAEQRDHVDFFGNISSYFSVETEHRHLAVVATTTVSVQRPLVAGTILESTSWERVRDAVPATDATRAFRLPSPRISPSAAVRDYASPSFEPGRAIGQSCAISAPASIATSSTGPVRRRWRPRWRSYSGAGSASAWTSVTSPSAACDPPASRPGTSAGTWRPSHRVDDQSCLGPTHHMPGPRCSCRRPDGWTSIRRTTSSSTTVTSSWPTGVITMTYQHSKVSF
jgi:transglutaminase superfamily protein/uncharacterized protein with alpha-helical domain and ER motif/circularly permuted ATPgrasp domain protein